MSESIGTKVKELRTNAKLTLRELSEKTGLSTGFLSQLERGLTSVATDSLQKVAKALNVETSYFFANPTMKNSVIIKNYDKQVMKIDNERYISYLFSANAMDKTMMPRIIDILPCVSAESLAQYQHDGEEFIYVIEGTLTMFINGQSYELYPGDGAHYNSQTIHNYANYTTKMVRILEVSTPNYFSETETAGKI